MKRLSLYITIFVAHILVLSFFLPSSAFSDTAQQMIEKDGPVGQVNADVRQFPTEGKETPYDKIYRLYKIETENLLKELEYELTTVKESFARATTEYNAIVTSITFKSIYSRHDEIRVVTQYPSICEVYDSQIPSRKNTTGDPESRQNIPLQEHVPETQPDMTLYFQGYSVIPATFKIDDYHHTDYLSRSELIYDRMLFSTRTMQELLSRLKDTLVDFIVEVQSCGSPESSEDYYKEAMRAIILLQKLLEKYENASFAFRLYGIAFSETMEKAYEEHKAGSNNNEAFIRWLDEECKKAKSKCRMTLEIRELLSSIGGICNYYERITKKLNNTCNINMGCEYMIPEIIPDKNQECQDIYKEFSRENSIVLQQIKKDISETIEEIHRGYIDLINSMFQKITFLLVKETLNQQGNRALVQRVRLNIDNYWNISATAVAEPYEIQNFNWKQTRTFVGAFTIMKGSITIDKHIRNRFQININSQRQSLDNTVSRLEYYIRQLPVRIETYRNSCMLLCGKEAVDTFPLQKPLYCAEAIEETMLVYADIATDSFLSHVDSLNVFLDKANYEKYFINQKDSERYADMLEETIAKTLKAAVFYYQMSGLILDAKRHVYSYEDFMPYFNICKDCK